MRDLIFVYTSSTENIETIVLAESIREYGGKYSDSPIWLYTTEKLDEMSEERKKKLDSLEVEVKDLKIDNEVAKFPFTSHVRAAAQAEEEAEDKTHFLAYLGSNSIIIQEPSEFILEEEINLGYRPVHHKLIGSSYNEPIDLFWEKIYQICEVSDENIFPMKTHVDGNILRPYINSGYLIVRPSIGFLRQWWKVYKNTYGDNFFKDYYQKDDLYLTFIHQAVLSGILLSYLSKNEIKELPFTYNYPINLYHESLEEYKPKCINDLVTARYYLKKLLDKDAFEKIPFKEPLKGWLKSRIYKEE